MVGLLPWFVAACIFPLLLVISQGGMAAPQATLFFAERSEDRVPSNIPKSNFDCDQKIFAVIDFQGFSTGTHELVATWIRPDKKKEQRTRLLFQSTQGNGRVWVWLKLFQPTGIDSILERALLSDNASGMRDFIGKWRFKAMLGSMTEVNGGFSVSC